MKFQLQVVCLCALFSIVFALTPEEEIKIGETCKKETEASDDDMKVLDDINTMASTKTQYCLLACFYKAAGIMDANNKVIYEKAIMEIEPIKKENNVVYEKLDKILQDCTTDTIPEPDQCDSMKKYLDCITNDAKIWESISKNI